MVSSRVPIGSALRVSSRERLKLRSSIAVASCQHVTPTHSSCYAASLGSKFNGNEFIDNSFITAEF